MKPLLIVSCLLLLACPPKREIIVPVLLDYDLYYPDEARRQGLEGTVQVRVLVNRSGRTEDVAILESSGSYLLDSAAVRTAQTFVFSPAMLGDVVQRAWVLVPIEFKFREVDYEEWLAEVEMMHHRIAKEYSNADVEELYGIYKQMIFAPWDAHDLEFNDYIRRMVVDRAASIWEGFWSSYPARVILFVDIINRYPDSFTALKARADLSSFLEKERTTMRYELSPAQADTVVNRIMKAIKF